ncbi:MAG: UvrD-helicase domain-containing protein, partial [Janthinobacterium lividum]
MGVIAFPPPTIPDLADRTAALDVTQSCIVEAPAGSGKTGLLIQRYLKLLAIVSDPAEVLALTFTKKATGEMRHRVLAALRAAEVGTKPDDNDFARLTHELAAAALAHDRALGWHVLDRPHRLNIRTIDSLCSVIARAAPLLSGSAGFASPVTDAEPLYRQAAHAVFLRMGAGDARLDAAIETVLLHRDGNLQACEQLLAEMLATREQWGRLIPLAAAEMDDAALNATVLPRLNASLKRALCAALTRLHSCFPEEELLQIAHIARQLASADGHNGSASVFAPCASMPGAPGTDAEHLNHWLLVAQLLLTKAGTWRKVFAVNSVGAQVDKKLAKQLKDLMLSLDSDELLSLLHDVRELPPADYPAGQWVVAKALFRLLQHALVELQLLFAHDEVCDFSAVALAARSALQDDAAEVQVATGTRLQHLLVDEMQDSSSSQYELLGGLVQGWDGGSQTVFLVGDPKQSIYLFRQARVELFQQCMEAEALGDLPLQALRLSANFRSGRGIVEQFNDTFLQVFPSDRVADGDVTYSPADAVRPATQQDGIRWHHHVLPRINDAAVTPQQRARAGQDEAATIARIVEQQRKQKPGIRIAVLTRARSHITDVTKALAECGIPYRAVDMDALGERREVLDILAITRALLHPADRTAWLAVLHAPWCGAGLADLFRLAAGDEREHRAEALRLHLRERSEQILTPIRGRVLHTLDVMDAALQHTGTESLSGRVERTWRSLGGDACTDATGRENVQQFLRVLDAMEAANEAVTSQTLERQLQRLFALPGRVADAVDIMTIHKAKGLEWDLVLVPGMHRVSAQDRSPALNWLEMPAWAADGTRDVLLAPLPRKGEEADKLHTFIRNTRALRANAELKRVFYVAATRARTELHLFAWPDATKDGLPTDRNGTLLRAAGRAVPPFPLPEDQNYDSAVPVGEQPSTTLALAAAAETEATDRQAAPTRCAPMLERLVAGYDPLEQLHRRALRSDPRHAVIPAEPFHRPDGSFGARAVGNTIHAFLQRLGNALAAELLLGTVVEQAAATLVQELPNWTAAICAALRAGGLPPDEVARATQTVLRALSTMLETADGRWLLLPHPGASSEAAWRSQGEDGTLRVRLDRSFFAGPRPLEAGTDTLWIVDFKTADHGPGTQESVLAEEKKRYQDQLETYAA